MLDFENLNDSEDNEKDFSKLQNFYGKTNNHDKDESEKRSWMDRFKGKHHSKKEREEERGPHHKKGCCAFGPILVFVLLIVHFVLLKKLHTA